MSYSAPADFKDPSQWDFIAITPKAITEPILQLCSQITQKYGQDAQLPPAPVFVEIKSPFGEEGMFRCYDCVTRVDIPGSRMVHGFLIWELKGIYVSGEHHAIVQMPDGSLVDVTPQMAGEKRILFLPVTYNEAYNEGGVLSEFLALSNHRLVQDVVLLKRQLVVLALRSRAHTVQYRAIDDKVYRNVVLYRKLMADRKTKAKKRRKG